MAGGVRPCPAFDASKASFVQREKHPSGRPDETSGVQAVSIISIIKNKESSGANPDELAAGAFSSLLQGRTLFAFHVGVQIVDAILVIGILVGGDVSGGRVDQLGNAVDNRMFMRIMSRILRSPGRSFPNCFRSTFRRMTNGWPGRTDTISTCLS